MEPRVVRLTHPFVPQTCNARLSTQTLQEEGGLGFRQPTVDSWRRLLQLLFPRAEQGAAQVLKGFAPRRAKVRRGEAPLDALMKRRQSFAQRLIGEREVLRLHGADGKPFPIQLEKLLDEGKPVACPWSSSVIAVVKAEEVSAGVAPTEGDLHPPFAASSARLVGGKVVDCSMTSSPPRGSRMDSTYVMLKSLSQSAVRRLVAGPARRAYNRSMAACHFCGHMLAEDAEIHRSSTCPSCGKDLRICLNCAFYAPGRHWDCRETIGELVAEKDRANFCDWFSLLQNRPEAANRRARDAARAQFDSLFGDE